MQSMQDITPNDQYRRDYAVVAKHILCESTEISLYQIERFALSGPLIIKAVSVGFEYIWKNHLKENVMKYGKAILGTLGTALTGGIGLAVAVALGGLLYAFDTKKKPTIESQVKNVLDQSRISSIDAYLKAYQSCFQSVQDVQNYCKSIQSPQYLIELESRLNKVRDIIMGQGSEQRPLNVNLDICALFYKLAKLVIQLHCLISPASLKGKLEDLKSYHKEIKKKMVGHIQKKVKLFNKSVRIYDSSDNKVLQFQDQDSLMASDLFQIEIYDEIFRCPITKLPIDDIFIPVIWLTKSDKTDADIQKLVDSNKVLPFLGVPFYKYSNKIKDNSDSRIRELGFNKQKDKWTGYYESLSDKSGFYYQGFAQTKIRIKLDNYRVIFLSTSFELLGSQGFYCRNLLAVTNDHKIEVIWKIMNQKFNFSEKLSYSLEMDKFSIIKSIETESLFNMRFVCQPKSPKKDYGPFYGFIQTEDKKYRLGFGKRATFNWTKGYTFHTTDEGDSAQKLIFEAVTPIEWFSKGVDNEQELSEFTCRIKTEYDPTMFMVRDNLDDKVGVFGNNTGGGELIRIQLTKRNGKGDYKGKVSVKVQNSSWASTYVSASSNLKWSLQDKKDRESTFIMRIKQE